MAPRTAAPGEIILEGNDGTTLTRVDACGHSEPVSPGMLLAQSEFVAAAKRVGPCTRLLELDVYEAAISRSGTTHPYVRCVTETVTPFGVSVKRVESGVRKYTPPLRRARAQGLREYDVLRPRAPPPARPRRY